MSNQPETPQRTGQLHTIMKRTILLIALTVALMTTAFTSNAQSINGIQLKDIDAPYVEAVGIMNLVGKIKVDLDFGQKQNVWKEKDNVITDADGNVMKFISMVDVLNFMTQYGYEFVTAYAVTTGNVNVYHYLLRKKPIE